MASLLLSTDDNMATPCSVKQKGAYLKPNLSELEVTNCDLQSSNSLSDISNIKSSLNLSIFLRTACLRARVSSQYRFAKSRSSMTFSFLITYILLASITSSDEL